jgi:adenylate cyclase
MDKMTNSPINKGNRLSGKDQLTIKPIFLIKKAHFLFFLALIVVFLFISCLYLLNILQWGKQTDFGWSVIDAVDKIELVEVFGEAEIAGLRVKDTLIGVNNEEISSLSELRRYLVRDVPGENTYEIDRQGETLIIKVTNNALGFAQSFIRFGFTWILGLIVFILGVVVFIMKPGTRPSWAFLITMFTAGVHFSFLFTSKLSPEWLNNIRILTSAFLPAAILHIAQTFPREWHWTKERKSTLWAPYIFSLCLFLAIRSEALLYADISSIWKKIMVIYTVISLIVFFTSTIYTFIRPESIISRIRSRIILLGSAAAAGVPMINLVSILFFNVYLIRHHLVYDTFYLFLPVSLGYAIARHNLFDVDVYIKRAVGYVIMTVVVGLVYFAIQLGLRTAIMSTAFSSYAENVYPIVFALFVVFLFNPINHRIQGFVDRLFYRKKFDYRDTVLSISNALTSVLNIDEIVRRIIETVRKEMYIDRTGVILMEAKKDCKALFVNDTAGNPHDDISEQCLRFDDPLLELMSQEKKMITIYDIDELPQYKSVREDCGSRLSEIGATVVIPFMYQDNVTGVLTLGNKKSGHFYSRDDIDLLETLSNQGAVAIENAKMAEQMKKEETVRTNLSRYLSPQIVDQIVTNDVQVDLGGDRKVVTILFSDIRDFTTITETRPADQLIQILNEYFTEMAAIIFEYQGSLDKYIGDAMVAVFGSLINLDNPVYHAVRASIQMMKRLPDLNKKWMDEFGFSMEIGIGVTTGEVFLGNIGSPERMEFTVIGDTVNVASRFSGLAKAGQILLTREAFQNIDGSDIKHRELPPSKVKGKSEELEVFEIIY